MCYLDSFIDVIDIICREVKEFLFASFLSDSCARCSIVFRQEDAATHACSASMLFRSRNNMNIAVYLSELFASCGKLAVLGTDRFTILSWKSYCSWLFLIGYVKKKQLNKRPTNDAVRCFCLFVVFLQCKNAYDKPLAA